MRTELLFTKSAGASSASDPAGLRAETRPKLARLMAIMGIWGLACGLAGEAVAGQPADFHYKLVPLDATVPKGFDGFDPLEIADNGLIYGDAWACSAGGCKSFLAVYLNGATVVLR